jgi:hypothetical protein
MEIKENKKIDILLNLLNERYNASHKMRERSLNFTTWILGFGIALAWILLTQVNLNFVQKIFFTIFVILLGTFTLKFLASIEVGFNRNREIIIKIEQALGCYTKNLYCENKVLFPDSYKDFNNKRTWHFRSLYIWVSLITVSLIVIIWLNFFNCIIKNF